MAQGLMLHMGSAEATLEDVRKVETPEATKDWTPIPHALLYETVAKELTATGAEIEDVAFGLWGDGARFFGTFALTDPRNDRPDYRTIIGIRNSHDKSFSAGLVAGNRVIVCDNSSFWSEVRMARKHTTFIVRDLPALTNKAVAKLSNLRGFQDSRFDAYKAWPVTDQMAHDFIIRTVDVGILPPTLIKKLLAEWRKPTHVEFTPRTAWSLFNCYTEVYKGAFTALPARTMTLHGMLDNVVGVTRPESVEDADYTIEVAA